MDSPRQFFAKRMGGANPLLISKDSLPGICCLVHICHSPSARIIFPLQRGIPGECFSSRASHARHTGHASGSRLTGEVFFENATIVIFLLILWWIDGKPFGGMFHLMVGDGGRSNGFQCINPIVTDAIGELLFLPPGNHSEAAYPEKLRAQCAFPLLCPDTS